MTDEFVDSALAQVREVINRLQSPVPDLPTLCNLLASPLACLGLLPPQLRRYNTSPLPDDAVNVPRHIPPLQRALLEHVIPTWQASLEEHNAILLVEQYFCPDAFSFASPAAGDVTLLAYSTILSGPLSGYCVHLLSRLSKEYPVDRLYRALFSDESTSRKLGHRQEITWEDCVRDLAAVPAKVANALGGRGDIPPLLEHAAYFDNLSLRCESLILFLSKSSSEGTYVFSHLLGIQGMLITSQAACPHSYTSSPNLSTSVSFRRRRLRRFPSPLSSKPPSP